MKRIVFIHIPKTAGTSFRLSAQEFFGEKQSLWDYGLEPASSELARAWNEGRINDVEYMNSVDQQNIKLISGHFHASKYINIVEQGSFLSFVRDPLKRVISEYNHLVTRSGLETSFEEFYRSKHQTNRQSQILSGIEIDKGAIIGITERFDESLNMINHLLGTNFKPMKLNEAYSSVIQWENLTQSVIDEIIELNAKDYALYQEANKALDEFQKNKHFISLSNRLQMLPSCQVIVTEDKSFLKKNDNQFSDDMLAPGWRSGKTIKVNNIIYILTLEHDNGGKAAWYFNNDGYFIGNKISKLNLPTKQRNLIVGGLFQAILEEITNERHPKELLSILQHGSFLTSEVMDLIDSTSTKRRCDTMSIGDMDVMKQLAIPGRDVQDAYIGETNLQAIVKIKKHDDEYRASHGLVLNDFTIAYPCKNKQNQYIIIFESSHYNNRFAALDCTNGELYEDPKAGAPSSIHIPLRLLLEHISENADAIREYLSAPVNSKVGILRNVHLGHNLWNDLTALFRIEQNGLLNNLEEIVVFGGERSEPWIKLDDFSNSARINREIRSQKELITYFYSGHKFPIRLGDAYIAKEITKRIIAHSDATCTTDATKSPNELRVVFGLRLENRTWLNQKEGLYELAKYLTCKTEKLSIFVDGHDVISSTSKVHVSHHESADGNIVALEKEISDYLREKLQGSNVKIVDGVAMTLECSVKWIDSADFFIAPWGAGLAKYKWICNLPGIIMTSRWNLANKSDLKIYESPNIREGATPCIYVAPEYIEDRDCSTNLVILKDMPEHPSRADFIVDIEGIKLAIDELLSQMGIAP